jgi:4-diphosphocytidyl-2-C-methyl-D-erythritol kinase
MTVIMPSSMPLKSLTLTSPAKLNLFLHINGRLDNGYHELQSLFHFLDKGDELTFQLTDNGKVTLDCNLPELISEQNLIIKAVNALTPFLTEEHKHYGVSINLQKVLPMGGGVGGGSSNAATTLLALNQLWQLHLPAETLESIGKDLGADVPIFIRGKSSIAEGIGEKLFDYPIEEKWYLVLTPNAHVNTALLFNSDELPRNTTKIDLSELNYTGLSPNHKNDFETLVYKNYPAVAKALDWLLEYAPARLTGTGACVFSVFENQQEAETIFTMLPADLSGFIAKGCNISITHQQLREQLN